MMSKWAKTRSYIVSPINGVLKYHRLGKQERNDPETPFERVSVTLSDVSLMVTEVLLSHILSSEFFVTCNYFSLKSEERETVFP